MTEVCGKRLWWRESRRQWRNVFGINEREQQYVHMMSQPKNEKYANGSVGARVGLMVRGGCLPVRGSKGMEWKYDDDLCVCGTKETEIHVLFECKCYDMVRRRWLRTWDDKNLGSIMKHVFSILKRTCTNTCEYI